MPSNRAPSASPHAASSRQPRTRDSQLGPVGELATDIPSPAFGTGPATRGDLLAAATANRARPEVIEVLQRLPELPYRTVRDLWQELADLPVGT